MPANFSVFGELFVGRVEGNSRIEHSNCWRRMKTKRERERICRMLKYIVAELVTVVVSIPLRIFTFYSSHRKENFLLRSKSCVCSCACQFSRFPLLGCPECAGVWGGWVWIFDCHQVVWIWLLTLSCCRRSLLFRPIRPKTNETQKPNANSAQFIFRVEICTSFCVIFMFISYTSPMVWCRTGDDSHSWVHSHSMEWIGYSQNGIYFALLRGDIIACYSNDKVFRHRCRRLRQFKCPISDKHSIAMKPEQQKTKTKIGIHMCACLSLWAETFLI